MSESTDINLETYNCMTPFFYRLGILDAFIRILQKHNAVITPLQNVIVHDKYIANIVQRYEETPELLYAINKSHSNRGRKPFAVDWKRLHDRYKPTLADNHVPMTLPICMYHSEKDTNFFDDVCRMEFKLDGFYYILRTGTLDAFHIIKVPLLPDNKVFLDDSFDQFIQVQEIFDHHPYYGSDRAYEYEHLRTEAFRHSAEILWDKITALPAREHKATQLTF